VSGAASVALGRARLADGDLRGALQAARAALASDAGNASAHVLHARLLRMQGDLDGAEGALQLASSIAGDDVEMLMEQALLARERREFDTALEKLAAVVSRDPRNARAHLETGRVMRIRGSADEAMASQLAAIEADPSLCEAYTELGWLRNKRGDYPGALEAYERALALEPDNLTAHHNLGFILGKLERYERALELLERLCERLPEGNASSWVNLAAALAANGEVRRAAQIYERVLATEPNNVSARWNRSHFILAGRDFARGWEEYEWRFLTSTIGEPRLIPHAPWRGEALAGKSLLVTAEQGLGDQIMFASCLPELVAAAGRVTVECNTRLEALFRRSFPLARVIGSAQDQEPRWLREVGGVDLHASMGSLPLQLRKRIEDFPAHRGYLRADPERVAHWRSRLAALGPGRKVGLSWRGGTQSTRARLRSLGLADLEALCRTPGCRFVNLQYGKCEEEIRQFTAGTGIPVAHWPEAIEDYDETAALCTALDLTISVCTSVIHLNGALGRPVWILVPSAPEWRYGFAGDGMPWYPSATLFRQEERSTWTPVLERVREKLSAWAGDGPG
jgi:tetratricopeptide (TPR) repeat protein